MSFLGMTATGITVTDSHPSWSHTNPFCNLDYYSEEHKNAAFVKKKMTPKVDTLFFGDNMLSFTLVKFI